VTCSRSKGHALVLVFLLHLSSFAFAAPLSGTKSVGPTGDYATLTAAIADIQTQTLGAALVLELQSNYVSGIETFPLVFTNLGTTAMNTLTIRPQAGATARFIAGEFNTTTTVDLDGAQYVTFDGRPGGVGGNAGSGGGTASQLTIESYNTSGVALGFINEASNNTLRYVTVRGRNTSATSGTVVFSTTTGVNGNDNNTIDHCDVGDGASLPVNGIQSLGTVTTLAQANSGNTISNSNIFNFQAAPGIDSAGLFLGSGNTDWSITGNSFYQTTTRSAVSATVRPIYIRASLGNNFTVTGNFIGGSAPGAGGSPWRTTGTTEYYHFNGILLGAGYTTPSNVQGNTIQNMVWTDSSGSLSLPGGSWCGIYLAAGSANIGTTQGNTIGGSTGTGSIVVTCGSEAISYGIGSDSNGGVNIANNTVGSIATNGAVRALLASLVGIQVTAGVNTISNNTVGSPTTANSLNAFFNSSANVITQQVIGILSSSSVSANITGNTVANLNNNYIGTDPAGQVLGIVTSNGLNSIVGNTVRNLSTTSNNTGSGSSSSAIGISQSSTIAGQTVSQNTIYSLTDTAASAAVNVTGIYFAGPTSGANVIARNLVHSLAVSSTNAFSGLNGMHFAVGTFTAQNNMVRAGIKADGSSAAGASFVRAIFDFGTTPGRNFYHNSVYLGGTQTSGGSSTFAFLSSGSTNARTFQNNIFVNARSNSGGTGKHYAVRYGGAGVNPTGLKAGGNLILANGTGGVLGFYNSADLTTLTAWQAATSQDATSLSMDPLFVNPMGDASTVDLHLQPNSSANNGGVLTTGVLDDFDGAFRALDPPDIGADEFYSNNATLTALTLSGVTLTPGFDPNSITYTATVPNATTSTTVTATPADVNVLAQIKINGSNFAFPPAIPLSVSSNTITVLVTAYDGTTTKTYTVTVTRKSVFQEWAASNTLASDPSALGSNGIKNLLNFAFSVNPSTGSSGALVYTGTFAGSGTIASTGQPKVMMDPATNGTDIRGLFVRRKDAVSAGLTYTPQFSADLSSWQVCASTPTVLADDSVNQIVSVPYPPLVGGQQAKFFRIQVTLAP
jgi:hypothetical protein